MRVLICGGRDYADFEAVQDDLERLLAVHGADLTVIHGGCATGADKIADKWAKANGIPRQVFAADWLTHQNKAGPMRNQRMLDEGKPDLVIAFPGRRGTADMIRRTKAAGVRLIDYNARAKLMMKEKTP
jgi:hypothetical protein